ncbi:helix-turn-helix domain-containing protein [Mesorhizobium sp. M00.F.Ca.ET.216.01.1.1]|uniref:helix-turn-helix domain-containing protein n=1 Tax=Mesorhizobium sp. M00.F.Ca.ET.216.01.1.1 TaxID=2500528 RepID=UPI000FDC725A|nr:helix-turn-helix domain-containing protein [Mesorhizobium sp. M00.F.Ca.ET.216.01.1.1]TGQ41183.1 helix-turn-helix domain-containing protein [Mesorhizobium sp. M00.F.Ca.ET.216.01.1.1]
MASEQTAQFFAYKALCIAKLSSGAKRVGGLLLDHRNEKTRRCDPSLRTIVRRLGISKSSVLRGLEELIKAGLFRRIDSDTNRTAYQVNFVKLRAIVTAFEATRKPIPRKRKNGTKTGTVSDRQTGPKTDTQGGPKSGTRIVPKVEPQHNKENTLNLTLGFAAATPPGFQIEKSNGKLPSKGPPAPPPKSAARQRQAEPHLSPWDRKQARLLAAKTKEQEP